MRNILKSLLLLTIVGTPLTVHATVTPSDWTGSVVVTGDGVGGIDFVPAGLAPLASLELKTGAIVNQANDLTIDGSTKIGTDSTLSTYNVTAGTLTANVSDLLIAYGATNQGAIYQTGGTVDLDKNIVISFDNASVGTYTISGANSLCEAGWTIIGEGAGSSGNLIIENGATYKAQVTNGWSSGPVSVGFNGGTGTLSVATGGTLEAREITIGQIGLWAGNPAGHGTATLGEGNIAITHGNFYIGKGSGSTGLFTQTDGVVDLITQSDGTWQKDLVIGYQGTGTYDMQGGSFLGDFSILGEAGGSGTLNISGDASFVTKDLTIGLGTGTGALNLSGGTLNTGTIVLNNASTFTFTGGTLSADTVSGVAVVQAGGVVSPGDSPGTSVFNAGYTMEEAGTYLVEIAGDVQGDSYDYIAVTGNASLAGKLEVNILEEALGDITPFLANATTYTFDVLTADTITLAPTFNLSPLDDLSYFDLSWTYEVLGDAGSGQTLRLQLANTTVPEPSTIILLLGLVAGMLVLRRR